MNILLDNDFIELGQGTYSLPCLRVCKQHVTNRLCIVYKKANALTKSDSFPVTRINDCIDQSSKKARFMTKFDVPNRFWQVPFTDRAQDASAFVTRRILSELCHFVRYKTNNHILFNV